MSNPRPFSLTKFAPPGRHEKEYPLETDKIYIFLSEIINMPGHCIVIEMNSNKIFSGFHTDCFVELTEDKI